MVEDLRRLLLEQASLMKSDLIIFLLFKDVRAHIVKENRSDDFSSVISNSHTNQTIIEEMRNH